MKQTGKIKNNFVFNFSDDRFIMLINVKTIVGILTLMTIIIFMHS